MIEGKNDPSKNLEKALQALKQAKRRVANEKKKQNEKKRKAENIYAHESEVIKWRKRKWDVHRRAINP